MKTDYGPNGIWTESYLHSFPIWIFSEHGDKYDIKQAGYSMCVSVFSLICFFGTHLNAHCENIRTNNTHNFNMFGNIFTHPKQNFIHPASDKPLSEPMMVSVLMHILMTWPQWFNVTAWHKCVLCICAVSCYVKSFYLEGWGFYFLKNNMYSSHRSPQYVMKWIVPCLFNLCPKYLTVGTTETCKMNVFLVDDLWFGLNS